MDDVTDLSGVDVDDLARRVAHRTAEGLRDDGVLDLRDSFGLPVGEWDDVERTR